MSWKTRFTSNFGCRLPILGAPMAGVSGGLLAAETCRAGALGFIAAGHLGSVEDLEREISIFREHAPPGAPLALGFIGHSSLKDGSWDRVGMALNTHKPEFVQFFAPAVVEIKGTGGKTNIDLAHDHQCQVFAQVGSTIEAEAAIAAGADCLIAQGSEAGGHGLRRNLANGTLPLVARIVTLSKESQQHPIVLAAGGIVDGRGLAAALALGCDGIVLGTRLWATKEAMGNDKFKEQLVKANGPDEVVRTTVIDQINNTFSSTPWPSPYDSVGTLRNDTTEEWDGEEEALRNELCDNQSKFVARYKEASTKGDFQIVSILAGEGVGDVKKVDDAHSVITQINEQAIAIINGMSNLISDS